MVRRTVHLRSAPKAVVVGCAAISLFAGISGCDSSPAPQGSPNKPTLPSPSVSSAGGHRNLAAETPDYDGSLAPETSADNTLMAKVSDRGDRQFVPLKLMDSSFEMVYRCLGVGQMVIVADEDKYPLDCDGHRVVGTIVEEPRPATVALKVQANFGTHWELLIRNPTTLGNRTIQPLPE